MNMSSFSNVIASAREREWARRIRTSSSTCTAASNQACYVCECTVFFIRSAAACFACRVIYFSSDLGRSLCFVMAVGSSSDGLSGQMVTKVAANQPWELSNTLSLKPCDWPDEIRCIFLVIIPSLSASLTVLVSNCLYVLISPLCPKSNFFCWDSHCHLTL